MAELTHTVKPFACMTLIISVPRAMGLRLWLAKWVFRLGTRIVGVSDVEFVANKDLGND